MFLLSQTFYRKFHSVFDYRMPNIYIETKSFLKMHGYSYAWIFPIIPSRLTFDALLQIILNKKC